jgi:hypothetical protein
MDPRCFDHLVKTFGTSGASRRDVVRRIAGGVVGAAAAMLGLRTATAACTGRLCNFDSECCAGTNCLNGGCNPCASTGATCSSRKPCCRQTRTTCCDNICVNTRTSNNHCGACDRSCPRGSYCSSSKCCPDGTVNRKGICCPFTHQNCNGECKNLQSDKENCGTCGNRCADNFICSKGKCCPNGRINCSGVCVNLRTDEDNCGACGRRCASTSRCVDRSCTPLEQ